jgi:hypothetical protein
VAGDVQGVPVIHRALADFALVPRETGWLDDLKPEAKAGAQAYGRADVLRDVGLIEGQIHLF